MELWAHFCKNLLPVIRCVVSIQTFIKQNPPKSDAFSPILHEKGRTKNMEQKLWNNLNFCYRFLIPNLNIKIHEI